MIIWFQDEENRDSGEKAMAVPFEEELMEEAAEICLGMEGIDPSQTDLLSLSVSFVSEDRIRELNRSYRSKDSVTDVLSFPMYSGVEEIRDRIAMDEDMDDFEISLGDVVICREKIVSQAEEYGHSQTRELIYLFVHSLLHLLGYDHMDEEEKDSMRGREEEIMEKIGLNRTPDDESLYMMAEEARENAYAPFSGFRVGAALLCSSGKVYTGVNVENSSYGATICAERTAFVKAISEGERSFEAIAVSAGEEEALPCGICRQFMAEFAPKIKVITRMSGEKKTVSRSLDELLPNAFVLKEER